MSVTLANGGDQTKRKFSDFYPTPPEATIALLDFLKLPRETIVWEPACGEGHMVNVLKTRFDRVTGSDITDSLQTDFLDTDFNLCDWIITNPPFSLAEQFIRHARKLNPSGGFAFLLKSQYWHAMSRLKLFRETQPSHVLPLTWRPDFHFGAAGGAPTMEVLWTVWQPPYDRECLYIPLEKP